MLREVLNDGNKRDERDLIIYYLANKILQLNSTDAATSFKLN